jgi:hypothetical protein
MIVYKWINWLNTVGCLLSSLFISLLLSTPYECCSWCSQPSVLIPHKWLYWGILFNVVYCFILQVRLIMPYLIGCVNTMQWWAYIWFLLLLKDNLISVRWTKVTTTNHAFQVCLYSVDRGKMKCAYSGNPKHYWWTEATKFMKTGKLSL